MDIVVTALKAREIIDSRSRPTLVVSMTLNGGTVVQAGVPSGASTGSQEAVEIRDGDPSRFSGNGVLKAVDNINNEIFQSLCGRKFTDLAQLDQALIDLDGTDNKSRLGANAIVGVSMAASRAIAMQSKLDLWKFLNPLEVSPRLPVPHFNVINGGVHSQNNLDFQEFMIAPFGASTVAEAIRAGAEVYAKLKSLLIYKKLATGLGDEGGFAPQIDSPEEVLTLLVQAIEEAGYPASRSGIAIALDPAASEFYHDGFYKVSGEVLTSQDMITRYEDMVSKFPIWSLEDGLAEGDWLGYINLTQRLGDQIQLVGDDSLVTNPKIIAKAIDAGAGTAALIKVNQIGTVTETLQAMELCRASGWGQMVSHRSGETEDSFIADLAVGSGCGQIKSGAPARGERVAKYNRLIEIESSHLLPYGIKVN